ncbi:MAG: hypothetical protein KAW56_00525 [Candidatus Marinimicrobia bacterium]|nr:hypothetical protein [Candidatus Neomarinimicrobiota bacterium]
MTIIIRSATLTIPIHREQAGIYKLMINFHFTMIDKLTTCPSYPDLSGVDGLTIDH